MPRERKNKKDGEEGTTKVKKRRTSAANQGGQGGRGTPGSSGSRGAPQMDMMPPMQGGYGETVFAGNPFDDYPPPPSNPGVGGGPPAGMHQGYGPPPPGPGHYAGPNVPHQIGPPPNIKPNSGPMMSGKVYPADQPRVFNSANPNAPPIYPCGLCHKEVHDNDQAILCESGCNFWYHRSCTGLSDAAYAFLNEEIYAEWACDNCMNSKSVPLVKCKP